MWCVFPQKQVFWEAVFISKKLQTFKSHWNAQTELEFNLESSNKTMNSRRGVFFFFSDEFSIIKLSKLLPQLTGKAHRIQSLLFYKQAYPEGIERKSDTINWKCSFYLVGTILCGSLTLFSRITLGGIRGPEGGSDQTYIGCVQGMCPIHCTISFLKACDS